MKSVFSDLANGKDAFSVIRYTKSEKIYQKRSVSEVPILLWIGP